MLTLLQLQTTKSLFTEFVIHDLLASSKCLNLHHLAFEWFSNQTSQRFYISTPAFCTFKAPVLRKKSSCFHFTASKMSFCTLCTFSRLASWLASWLASLNGNSISEWKSNLDSENKDVIFEYNKLACWQSLLQIFMLS